MSRSLTDTDEMSRLIYLKILTARAAPRRKVTDDTACGGA